VAAAESGTGALTGAAFGPYTAGEQTLALDLLPSFGPGMLVLADRNFLSHALAGKVLATGAHILWRASASFALRPVEALADGTCLTELKPARGSGGPPVTVRVIEYTVHTTAASGKDSGTGTSSEVFALVTDLLNIEAYPALDPARAYPMRWGCETVTGHHKTDMGEGQPVLRSKDPEGVAQEMWATFAAGGDHLPTWETVEAYVTALGANPVDWLRQWEDAQDQERCRRDRGPALAIPEQVEPGSVHETTPPRMRIGRRLNGSRPVLLAPVVAVTIACVVGAVLQIDSQKLRAQIGARVPGW
jgi:hypothetical protein